MITIYTSPTCYKCKEAKRRFNELNIPFDEVEIVFGPDMKKTLDYLAMRTKKLDLPVIFYNDEVVTVEEAISSFNKD